MFINKKNITILFFLFSFTSFCQDHSDDWWAERAERLAVDYSVFASMDFVIFLLPFVLFFLFYILYRINFNQIRNGKRINLFGALFVLGCLIYLINIIEINSAINVYKYFFLDEFRLAEFNETIGLKTIHAQFEDYDHNQNSFLILTLIYLFQFIFLFYTAGTLLLFYLSELSSDSIQPISFKNFLTLIFNTKKILKKTFPPFSGNLND
jgi:hypothetical protein